MKMSAVMQTRWVSLKEWAETNYSKVPHISTLLRWVNEGRIQPQPMKHGKSWMVRPHAEYKGD
jgi:predicted site-specific integrase-resolvase